NASDLPLLTHSSQTHIGQSSASPSSSHGSLSTFSAAPTTDERSKHLLFEDAGLTCPIDLLAVPDPPEGEKPKQPYPILIKLAIYGSPNKQLTLQEIYTALEDHFEWSELDDMRRLGRSNSIRHNLSLNKVFKHVPPPRKRRSKSARAALEQSDDDDSSSEDDTEGANLPPTGMPTGSIKTGSHIVGEGRTRSASRRSGTSPYPVLGPSQQSPRYLQNQLPTHGNTESAPRFGQPSFGQGGFGRPGFSQVPALDICGVISVTFGSVPVASTRTQHTFVTQDRNAPIYIHESGLPIPSSQGSSSSQQSDSSYPYEPKGKGRM
ncbi:hypothetical protein BDR07DRAFT_1430767, partial [Suillus spraguei]